MQQLSATALDDLAAFVILAETGSFAAAGRALNRDPTVVSRRLGSLERRLGVRLAERTTRRVALTEAGRAYLARIRPLLQDLQAADREAASFAEGEPKGHLRVALPGSFGRIWLGPVIVGFLRQHPHVTIEADATNLFIDLIGQGYDLAVRLGTLPDSRLIARKLADRRRLVCASPDYLARRGPIVRPQDLGGRECLYYTGRSDPRRWIFASPVGERIEVEVSGPLSSDNAEVLVGAAVEGLGVRHTSDWYVGRELADGRLVEVLPDWPVADPGAVYLVLPATAGLPSKTRAFADWIVRQLDPPPWVVQAL